MRDRLRALFADPMFNYYLGFCLGMLIATGAFAYAGSLR